MPNTGVRGRLVFAGSEPPQGIRGVTVSAFDIDPLIADEHLGTAVTDDDGRFTITYTTFAYRTWHGTRNPYIEVRIFGDGHRLLWAAPQQDEVQVDVLDVGTIAIHRNNFRVPESATAEEKRNDRSWLVTHTSLDPANFLPIRLTAGNQIEWLVDGAAMFPAVTEAVAGAQRSIKLVNLGFAVDDLISKFEFPPGKDHKTVEDGDIVNVHRLERIMAHKADAENVAVHVFSWDLASSNVFLGGQLDEIDLADEVEEYFANTNVFTDALEDSQLLHIKMVVVDGETAFVIGSTMKQGYFNDQEHAIRDARHGGRGLMHDVSLSVQGPAARYVDQTFTTLWNAGRTGTSVSPDAQQPEADTEVSVQVLRTLPGRLFTSEEPDPDTENLPFGETGILEAYQRAIMKAEEYIYIEDQYFTSDEIVTALKLRMAEKPDLEVILVLNLKPDIPGYQKKQTALINDLRKSLGANSDRLGVFTMWSNDADQPTYEITPIYVHAKLALIDDKWATVGTANLDGASLNQRQWGLILAGVFEQQSKLVKVLLTLFSPVLLALSAVASVAVSLLALAARGNPSLSAFILDSIRKEVAGTTQHANPHRERQPPRHPELNLVLYNDIAGQKPTDKIRELRESLWTEQLGAAPAPARPAGGWLQQWRLAADDYLQKVRDAADGTSNGDPTLTRILPWTPQDTPESYLAALGVETDFIDIRDGGEDLPFAIHEEQDDPNEETEDP